VRRSKPSALRSLPLTSSGTVMPHITFAIFLALLWQVEAQAPRFEDYAVTDVSQGTAAAPILSEPWMRMFRTRIREGVSKGYGVIHYKGPDPKYPAEEKEGPGPNFAGHHYVITWACGSECAEMAIVDGITGKVYPPPLAVGKDHPSMLQRRSDPRFEGGYRLDSKLFVMETCNWDDIRYHDEGSTGYLPCTLFYFTIESLGFKLIDQLTYETPLP